jgi:Leucine-rich repeat (LRR) protein
MKYLIGLGVIILIVGGVFIGFNLGKNDNNNATTSSSANEKVLDLSDSGLTSVSANIYNQTATTTLLLSNNSIKTLPSEMGKMTNLVVFKIDHNILEGSLIGEVRQMSKLKQLDVSYNKMTGMPAEIGQLSNLETLNYSYNKIDGLPNELGNLANNLREFNLKGNPLSQEKINKLKAELPNTNIIF